MNAANRARRSKLAPRQSFRDRDSILGFGRSLPRTLENIGTIGLIRGVNLIATGRAFPSDGVAFERPWLFPAITIASDNQQPALETQALAGETVAGIFRLSSRSDRVFPIRD
jgi:hypothetical protein